MTLPGRLDTIRIDAGGVPTDEELAALVATLGAICVAGEDRRHRRGEHMTSPWRQAAQLEGVGVGQAVSPADLRAWPPPATTATDLDSAVRGSATRSAAEPPGDHPVPWPPVTAHPPPAAHPR